MSHDHHHHHILEGLALLGLLRNTRAAVDAQRATGTSRQSPEAAAHIGAVEQMFGAE